MTEQVEEELNELREKNNELVKKVQYWKMTAAQRETEKLDLMKEMNELRLKLSRLRSGGAAHARKLDSALQTASEEVLSHLVQASSAVTHMLELNKTYMQERQELDTDLPRWSNLSNTPSSERVNRVPPMLIGGKLIQPVVAIRRTLQSNMTRTSVRSSNQQNHSLSERAVPMHMLQDLYIPLTRIDADLPNRSPERDESDSDIQLEDLYIPLTRIDADLPNRSPEREENDSDILEDSGETALEEPQNMSDAEGDESRRLESVYEEEEPTEQTPQRSRQENPLEGPSWLLDEPTRKRGSRSLMNFEPDSTTQVEENPVPGSSSTPTQSCRVMCEFTPTVRRRRRTPSTPPPPSPTAPHSPRPMRRFSNNGRVLKVVVARMCLDEDDGSGDASPPKRPNIEEAPKRRTPKERTPKKKIVPNKSHGPIIRDLSPSKRLMRFDAPSPNGSTDSRVIVLETKSQPEPGSSTNHIKESCGNVLEVNQNGNDFNQRQSTHDSVSNINQSHRCGQSQTVSHCNASGGQSDPGVSQPVPSVSYRDTSVGHRDPSVSHRDPSVSHRDPSVSHRDPSVSHRDPSVSHRDPSVSHRDPNVSHRDPNVSHRDPSVSHRNPNVSHRDPNVNHRNTSDTQSHVSRDSDSSGSEMVAEGRTRRPRKAVVYKEKPLNRKLRR